MKILDRFRLDGKQLFITGGSRGLGDGAVDCFDHVLPAPDCFRSYRGSGEGVRIVHVSREALAVPRRDTPVGGDVAS